MKRKKTITLILSPEAADVARKLGDAGTCAVLLAGVLRREADRKSRASELERFTALFFALALEEDARELIAMHDQLAAKVELFEKVLR